MKPDLDILFCVNDTFAVHAGVCIVSISRNNPDLSMRITLAALELSQVNTERFEALSKQTGIEIVVKLFDKELLNTIPQVGLYSKDVYIRLWVDTFYNELPDRVLYLDADTICVGDLRKLVALPLDKYLFAAVAIPGSTSQKRCIMPENEPYINSGVILFNMHKWCGDTVRAEISDYLNKHKTTALNPDQDALNSLYYEKRLLLDYKYNCISLMFRDHGLKKVMEKNQIEELINSVVIVHFNGGNRPWLYTCLHPYANHYLAYRQQSPWKDISYTDKTLVNTIKKLVRKALNLDSFTKINKLNGII